MTNNLELYKEYIKTMCPKFPQSKKGKDLDKYYTIEIISRGKDNPNASAANEHFKNYYIYCWEDFDKYMPRIIECCTKLRMRAYASVNWKSNRQVAMNTVAAMAKRIADGDFKRIYAEYESQSGHYSHRNENVWLIDVDDVDMNSLCDEEKISSLEIAINNCRSQFENNIIMKIPTKSGCHILCRPFDLNSFVDTFIISKPFRKQFPELDNKIDETNMDLQTMRNTVLNWLNSDFIHKNHITLLYENL